MCKDHLIVKETLENQCKQLTDNYIELEIEFNKTKSTLEKYLNKFKLNDN